MGSNLPPPAIYHVEDIADVHIRDGMVYCVIRSGEAEFEFCCSPHVMLGSVARATRAWGAYILSHNADVRGIEKHRARH